MPFPNHHSIFHAVRVLHDNLDFFRNSHENVKSVVVWLTYSDKNTLTADTLTAGDARRLFPPTVSETMRQCGANKH